MILQSAAFSTWWATEHCLTVLRALRSFLKHHVLREDGSRLEKLKLILVKLRRLRLPDGRPSCWLGFDAPILECHCGLVLLLHLLSPLIQRLEVLIA